MSKVHGILVRDIGQCSGITSSNFDIFFYAQHQFESIPERLISPSIDENIDEGITEHNIKKDLEADVANHSGTDDSRKHFGDYDVRHPDD